MMSELTTMAMGRIIGDYPPPRHNVVLLSCMDLRLINELSAFMDRDNLTNRYDHLVMAGASLGPLQKTYPNWSDTFFEHLRIAIQLHHPEDVYIVEHRACGAYREFLKLEFGNSPAEQREERKVHRAKANKLARAIRKWSKGEKDAEGNPVHLRVHSFLMDLRGDVEVLDLEEAS